MQYPTLQGPLILPDYGRNVQRMVEYAMTLTDRDERNRCADAIVRTMAQLNPDPQNSNQYVTLYDHLALMSGFQLDIDYPYGTPQPEELNLQPELLQYSNPAFPFRHYGRIIQDMIYQAIEEEDIMLRQELVIRIANRLKYAYLMWNKDQVDDEQIIADVDRLSQGQLSCDFPDFYLLEKKQMDLTQEGGKKKKK